MPLLHADPRVQSQLAIRVFFVHTQGGTQLGEAANIEPTLDDVNASLVMLNRIYALGWEIGGSPSALLEEGSLEPDLRLRMHRLSMESPLEVLGSIPVAYVASGGVVRFVDFFERIFNLPLSIKVDRKRLRAEGEGYEADRTEDEIRLFTAEHMLAALKEQTTDLRLLPAGAELIDLDQAGAPRDQAGALSNDDREEALDRSLRKQDREHPDRDHHAELRKSLRSGEVNIEGVINDPPPGTGGIRVISLLLALPGYGRVAVLATLKKAGISISMRLSDLSDELRKELIRTLRS
jgi:hypothetical protein